MKKQQTAQELLSTLKFNLTQFLADLRPAVQNHFASEQYTKKGPGRKHKQGHPKYIARQQEYSSFRRKLSEEGVLIYFW